MNNSATNVRSRNRSAGWPCGGDKNSCISRDTSRPTGSSLRLTRRGRSPGQPLILACACAWRHRSRGLPDKRCGTAVRPALRLLSVKNESIWFFLFTLSCMYLWVCLSVWLSVCLAVSVSVRKRGCWHSIIHIRFSFSSFSLIALSFSSLLARLLYTFLAVFFCSNILTDCRGANVQLAMMTTMMAGRVQISSPSMAISFLSSPLNPHRAKSV